MKFLPVNSTLPIFMFACFSMEDLVTHMAGAHAVMAGTHVISPCFMHKYISL